MNSQDTSKSCEEKEKVEVFAEETKTGEESKAEINQVKENSPGGYMVLAIIATVCGGCLFGLPAILFANKIKTASTDEEREKAKRNTVIWSTLVLVIALGVFIVRILGIMSESVYMDQVNSDNENSQKTVENTAIFGSLNGNTYTNEEFNFEMNLPANYSVITTEDPAKGNTGLKIEGKNDFGDRAISVSVDLDNTISSEEEAIKVFNEAFEKKFKEVGTQTYDLASEIKSGQFLNQERPYVEYKMTSKSSENEDMYERVYALMNGNYFLILDVITYTMDDAEDVLSHISPLGEKENKESDKNYVIPEDPFSGRFVGRTYENPEAGFKVSFPENYKLYNWEEKTQKNYKNNPDNYQVVVFGNLEDTAGGYFTVFHPDENLVGSTASEEDVLNIIFEEDSTKQNLENMGYKNVEVERASIEFCGKEKPCQVISYQETSEAGERSAKEIYCYIKKDKSLMELMFKVYNNAVDPQEIISMFEEM